MATIEALRQLPKVLECATFAWCASKALNLKEDDIPLDLLEEGLIDPQSDSEGATVLSLFMSRLVVHQELNDDDDNDHEDKNHHRSTTQHNDNDC